MKVLFLVLIFVFATSAAAIADPAKLKDPEVSHNPTACPDLTGKFLFETEEKDIDLELVSGQNSSGMPTLTMISNGTSEESVIDGNVQKIDDENSWRGSCDNQIVYFYYYQNAKVHSLETYSLDKDTNLVVTAEYFDADDYRVIAERK